MAGRRGGKKKGFYSEWSPKAPAPARAARLRAPPGCRRSAVQPRPLPAPAAVEVRVGFQCLGFAVSQLEGWEEYRKERAGKVLRVHTSIWLSEGIVRTKHPRFEGQEPMVDEKLHECHLWKLYAQHRHTKAQNHRTILTLLLLRFTLPREALSFCSPSQGEFFALSLCHLGQTYRMVKG